MTGVSAEVTAYLAAVRAALADLPPTERDDLLAEVEPSLVEAAAESGGNVAARLGPPEEFAAELRAAAGLHGGSPAASAPTIRDALSRIAADPRVSELRRLAPLWWLARAYVAVAAFALAIGAPWSRTYVVLPHLGSGAIALLVIAAAAVVSIWLGLTGRSRSLVELALVVAAVPVAVHLAHRPVPPTRVYYAQIAAFTPGLTYDGAPVGNVYPYSKNGKLLHDVLLYTGAGAPVDLRPGVPDPERRVVHTRSGKAVYNAFPVRYFEPGTNRVAHPNAAPKVRIPRLRAG
ncbi:MAG: hypothetical protein E6G22_10900 [Actinobacteria bacterium]|nr:MAG: hypothetical protein E6G22_10900 [Actinomycetota bacterium]